MPTPLLGPPTDEAALAALGEKGVLAIVCDSTNAMVEGHSGSELDVRRTLSALVRDLSGRVAVTCFASNVARMESVALAAQDAGRSVAIVGRSLRNMDAAARECGYLKTLPPFLTEDDIDDVPDDNILMLITGSQGEARSALSRIARDDHPRVSLGEGDTVIYSSRMIPGNERAIGTVQDNLVRRGVRLMTDDDHLVHVSGHPARDELRRMYRLVKPRYAVPVHGEWRHLSAHAELAREAGATPFMMEDGDIITLSPGPSGDHRQRPGRPAGAGRHAPGAAEGRGDVGPAPHAVQRHRRRQPRGRSGRQPAWPAEDQRAWAAGPGRSRHRAGSPTISPRRCAICRPACGATMPGWRMPRGRRCAGRWGGRWASGRWWMCI